MGVTSTAEAAAPQSRGSGWNRARQWAISQAMRVTGDPNDDAAVSLQKSAFIACVVLKIVVCPIWAAIYYSGGGIGAAVVPIAFPIVTLVNLGAFLRFGNYQRFVRIEMFLMLVMPFLQMMAVGGLVNSSALILWSLIAPLGALVFDTIRIAKFWIGLFFVLLLISTIADPFLGPPLPLPRAYVVALLFLNIVTATSIYFAVAYHFVRQLDLAQKQLMARERMAYFGQLTAGVAHEIKNPLNFINNFARLSVDLLGDLQKQIGGEIAFERRGEIDEIVADISGNLTEIRDNGRRADGIVNSMLAHARSGGGTKQTVDLGALLSESAKLAQGDGSVPVELSLDPDLGSVEGVSQDLTRVFVNLINNGIYAAKARAKVQPGHKPHLRIAARPLTGRVEVRIRDNGTGIPTHVRSKIFTPFFTTKPTGEGTGLGLSLSYDTIVRAHSGQITVESEENDYAEFIVRLPRKTH